jgi:hypothetical protein
MNTTKKAHLYAIKMMSFALAIISIIVLLLWYFPEVFVITTLIAICIGVLIACYRVYYEIGKTK